MNRQEREIYNAANRLLKANNTVTTLEIKNELRRTTSSTWNQATISTAMDKFQQEGKFTYSDNGVYRTYSQVTRPVRAARNASRAVATRASKISRTKAIELIENSKGHFFTVTFTKRDNSERTMNAQYSKKTSQSQSRLGYITVKDVTKGEARNVNTQTIKALTIGGKNYIVQ